MHEIDLSPSFQDKFILLRRCELLRNPEPVLIPPRLNEEIIVSELLRQIALKVIFVQPIRVKRVPGPTHDEEIQS